MQQTLLTQDFVLDAAAYPLRKRSLDAFAPILSRHMVDWSDLPIGGARLVLDDADVVTESTD